MFVDAKFAKENDAYGIFLRDSECEKVLRNSYFFLLYEVTSRLLGS
jgi:hypothetical protein